MALAPSRRYGHLVLGFRHMSVYKNDAFISGKCRLFPSLFLSHLNASYFLKIMFTCYKVEKGTQ